MADKLISGLPEATSIAGNDLLVTEQTSIAKKITAQNLLDSLDELWTGHGGIESFELYSSSGLSKTYRMTYADESYTDITITDGTGITDIVTTTSGLTHTITISLNDGTTKVFTVDDGVGISSISAPTRDGLEDTYTINLSDGSTSTFTVTNGASVSSITLNGTTISFEKDDDSVINLPMPTLRIRYSVTQPDDDNDIITTPSNYMGVAWALDSAVLHYTDYAWFKIKGETGDNAEVSSYTRQYKYDADGTQAPTTGYYSTIAAAQSAVGGAIQGKYLWIATTVTWNNGTPTVIYSASYQGLDGTGLSGVVKSIYMADTGISLSPDGNGQVTISDADIGSIADPATKSDGQVLTWDATNQVWYAGSVSTGTVNSVNNQLPDVGGNVTIYGTNVAMSSGDSTTVKAAIDAKPDDLSDLGVTASATELNYTDGVTSNIQDQLDAKQPFSPNVNTGTYKYFYVDGTYGNDANNGLADSTPFKTLDKALEEYRTGISSDARIYIIRNGTYDLTTEWFSSGSIHIIAQDTSLNPLTGVIIRWNNPTNNIQFYGVHTNFQNVTLTLANTSFRIYFEASTIALSNVEFTEKDARFYFCGIDFTDVKFKTVQFFHCNGLINKLTITNTSLDAADDAIVIQHGSNIALYNNVDSYGLVVQALSSAGANQLLRVLQSKITIATAPQSQTNYINGIYANGSVINISTALRNSFNTYSTNGNTSGGVPSIWVDSTTDLASLASDITGLGSDITGLDTRIDNLEKFTNYQTLTGSLNQITDCGVYYITNANTNIPNGTNGTLIVLPAGLDANNRIQIFRRLGTIGTNDGNLFVRRINSSSLDSSWWQFSGTLLS